MDYDIVFAALARDCVETSSGFLKLLDELTLAGLRVLAIVGENGSRDGTRLMLESNPAIRVVDTSFMASVGSRLARLAAGRAFVAKHVPTTKFVAVVDLDEPFFDRLTVSGLLRGIERVATNNVFAVAATSRPSYYDLLAFEDDTRSFSDLEQRIHAIRNPVTYYRLFRDVIYPQQRSLTSDSDIVCVSAFNGLCLYRGEDYRLAEYASDGRLCEHVVFNRSLAALTGQRMVIDGGLVLQMPSKHGPRSLVGFVLQRLRDLLRVVCARQGSNLRPTA